MIPWNAQPSRQLALQRRSREKLRQLIYVAEVENMGAVKVGGAIGRSQVERIVAVEKQAHAALLIESVGVGVGEAHLQAVAHSLFNVGLQRVVF